MRYWIHDRKRGQLVLWQLVRALRRIAGQGHDDVTVHELRGRSALLGEWQESLAKNGQLVLSFEQLERASRDSENGFIALDATCSTAAERVRFGMHDGAALFLEASPSSARRVTRKFKDVHPSPPGIERVQTSDTVESR